MSRQEISTAINEIDEKIDREQARLEQLYADRAGSDEPWDYTEKIRDQEQYIAGLTDGRERLCYRL